MRTKQNKTKGKGNASKLPRSNECIHCSRRIIQQNGIWIDPEATGDDSIWREVCDSHDTFDAIHEPKSKPESTADFKERLRAMIPKPPKNVEERPCVRSEGDRGYGYPAGANPVPTKPLESETD